jgi:hypothetical protein
MSEIDPGKIRCTDPHCTIPGQHTLAAHEIL